MIQPRPISKCKIVLGLYFRPFLAKSEVMFFQKMAICEYQILAIFGQFWPFRAHFGPWVSKVYLLQLFRCKKNNEITKSGSISLFGKLDPSGAPKPTLGPKTPLKGPGRAKIGVNAPHVVQLTGFGPKKPNLNRSVQRCVPFTRNQPWVLCGATFICDDILRFVCVKIWVVLFQFCTCQLVSTINNTNVLLKSV